MKYDFCDPLLVCCLKLSGVGFKPLNFFIETQFLTTVIDPLVKLANEGIYVKLIN